MTPHIIAPLVAWVFHIPDKYRLPCFIQICPANPNDLVLPPSGEQRKKNDLGHVHRQRTCFQNITESLEQQSQLSRGRPPLALPAFHFVTQLIEYHPSIGHSAGRHVIPPSWAGD